MQLGDEEQHAEQAVHDGRDALQGLGGQADQTHQLAAAVGVLHQPDGRKDAQRRGNQQCKPGHKHRVDERRCQGHVVGVILPREQLGLQVGDAHNQNVADEENQHGGGQQGRQTHKPAQGGCLHPGGAAVLPAVRHNGMGCGLGHGRSILCCGNLRHGRCLLSPD